MLLLVTYVLIALGFSFVCSVAEAVILSVSSAYISVQKEAGRPSGALLEKQCDNINRPLAAILTLNTIAHTVGAAGAGAQAAKIFGDAFIGLISAILTLLILVFSEIIPKTIGATYWRQLAPITSFFLKYLVLALYPFVWFAEALTRKIRGESVLKGFSRQELSAMAELSKQEGQLADDEADMLKSLLSFQDLLIRDAMTHRTVVFSISEETTVETFFHKYDDKPFSRIPIYESSDPEKITGFVLKSDLLLAQARGNSDKQVKEYSKDMITLLNRTPLAHSMPKFLESRAHMMLVVDEYGGLEGILTLEDLLEAMLGVEIVDEKDKTVSMKKVARGMWRKRARKLITDLPENDVQDNK